MPPASLPSSIRAFVQWRDPSVYAGEEIECVITFKNVAPVPGQEKGNGEERLGQNRTPSQAHPSQSRRSSIAQGKAPTHSKAPSMASSKGTPFVRGHRPALSLNVVSGTSRGGLHTAPVPAKGPNSAVKPTAGHGRSLSIISLGSDAASEGRGAYSGAAAKRPIRGHARSASLQVLPKPTSQTSPHVGGISPRQPSPLFESSTPPPLNEGQNEPLPIRPARRRPGTVSAGNTPQMARQNSLHKSPVSAAFNPGFQFPPQQPARKSPSPKPDRPRPPRSPANMHSGQHRPISPRPPEGWSGALSNLNPISRVMSESSTTGTPRTSSEFYSISNHSDETLTSEAPYQSQQNGRLLPKPSHSRQVSSAKYSLKRPSEPETLMMAYAQTTGYFVLDGSLVNAAPFEEVKRKGVQGGGGVVGIERAKRSSGMFGAFSWGNIGESLGGLLGADDMSSMAQMKANAGSRNIPLLATPQNLLFVDLRLGPGESKSYNYRFQLPRGLPPSYRGRAIKVLYHLALGVQRPERQAIKTVEIPFRTLGSYNSRGETLGHDLMSPYILLQDAARSKSIPHDPSTPLEFPKFEPKAASNKPKSPKQGLEDFLRYTERLLTENEDGQGILASPTSPTTTSILRKESVADQTAANVKDAVDFAILRANYVTSSSKQRQSEAQSANRFNIARAGQPVAVLTLLRPAYRLGEAVIGTIDFTASGSTSRATAQSPTYAVLAELESAERVDPSLALRSGNSINRVTRKVHAAVRENTLFSRQVSFNLVIPSTATPTFETTGVSLIWRLRVEFTTERQAQGLGLGGTDEAENEELLEELGSDERGTTSIARERLLADTFEIEVPLKIFGTPGVEPVSVDGEGLEI